jgi:hypothetical protein
MSDPRALALKFMVLCAIVLSAGCTYETGGKNAEDYTKSFPVSGRAEVRIHAFDARVHVITSDLPQVDVHVQYQRPGPDSALPFATRQDGNVVELTWNEESHDWWTWGTFGADLAVIEVRMPKNADLQLQTSNGAVLAEGLKGKLQAHTSNGAITVEGVDGDCELSSSNGRIQASGRFDSLDIHSSNGGVVAQAAAGSTLASRWSIATSNAGVDLSIPTDLKANLNVGTSNGGVQLELPVTLQGSQDPSHLRGSLNGGGPELSVHTSNGHIRISGA